MKKQTLIHGKEKKKVLFSLVQVINNRGSLWLVGFQSKDYINSTLLRRQLEIRTDNKPVG